jgi:hypothetical protein
LTFYNASAILRIASYKNKKHSKKEKSEAEEIGWPIDSGK